MDGRDTFDVFLSYNSSDHAAVLRVAETLRSRGLQPFLDRWSLAAGRPWLPELEGVLRQCRSTAIFIGPHGLGRIQQRERELALLRQASDPGFPVIPVLLSGTKPADLALGFLALNTWVDLRQGQTDAAIEVLAAGIRGQPPPPDMLAEIQRAKAGVCPYRGLHFFREEDAPFFHGRDAFVRSLIEATGRFPFVAVVGPSGSGKSSVVRAGLVPELRRREGNRTETWDIVTMIPAAEPLKSLAFELVGMLQPDFDAIKRREAANELAGYWLRGSTRVADTITDLVRARPDLERILLVVDQWEELYTSCEDQEARTRFIGDLLDASERSPVKIVMTVRADFFGKVLEDRALRDRIEQAVVTLAPMNHDELRRAMEEPAKTVGLMFEEHLVDEILDDVGNEPGGLPLLEFVLEMLWERRRGHELTHDAYWEIGKIQGAIAKRADEEFQRLPIEQQQIARRALVRLVNPGEGREDTRRRAELDELGASAAAVVKTLTARRLLVTGRDAASGKETVEVTHEALIQRWPTLKRWVDLDRAFLRSYHRIKEGADDWEAHEKDVSLLLPPGRRLEEGRDLLKTHTDDIEPIRGYIAESIRVSDRRARQKQNRARLLTAVFAVLFVISAGLALISLDSSHKATKALSYAQRAQSIFLAEKSQQETDGGNAETGVLLALAALPRNIADPTDRPFVPEAELALYSALSRLHEVTELKGHTGQINAASFSPDGAILVTASSDRTARIWDVASHKELAVLQGHEGAIRSTAFSPDGTKILTASEDNTARLWSADGGKELVPPLRHDDSIFSAAFNADGTKVITASIDDTARLWDATTGKELAVLRHDDDVLSAAFSPDGRTVVTTSYDMTAKLWDVATGAELQTLSGHEAEVNSATFSPDGTRVATTSVDGTARLWDVASGKELAVLSGHQSWLNSVAFSPDGLKAITTSGDHTARLWNLGNSQESVVLSGHDDEVTSATFSPDGAKVATASKDKTMRLWDAGNGDMLELLRGHDNEIALVKFSPDGSKLVTACKSGTARLWNANSALELAVLRSHEANIYRIYFSPDGTKVATASADATARIWEVPSGKELWVLRGHQDRLKSAAFSPDGTRLATASDDGTARLWDAVGGRELRVLQGHKAWVHYVAFSPDGKTIATASQDRTAWLWDAESGKELRVLGGHQDFLHTLTFSPDSTKLLTASADKTARLWDVASGRELAELSGHDGPVYWAIFNSAGTVIATASADKTARLWDASSGKELHILEGHQDEVTSVGFSPDDGQLITTSKDQTARLWAVADGKELAVLSGHIDGVKWASFNRSGTLLVTGSADTTARLWELPSGRQLAVLSGHDDDITRVMFSPDGTIVATASDDGTARLWRVLPDRQALIDYARSVSHRELTTEQQQRYAVGETNTAADGSLWERSVEFLRNATGL
jgi:WD40 repeat protein